MDSSKLLIVGGVVLGGFYLYNKNKKDKENAQALALANSQAQPQLQLEVETKPIIPTQDLSGFYTTTEATKKALEVVTKWISLLDAIPKESLTEENKNIINQRVWAEKAKQNKIDYDKALAEAKSKNLPQFTFQDTTYWTANEQDVRNGSFSGSVWVRNPNNWSYDNQFNAENSKFQALAETMSAFKFNQDSNLGDWVKRVKAVKFAEIYDILKVAFTKIPKSDVDRLVVLLPKYLMAQNDDFTYFQTEYEKNPFTIEEQLYLKDINIEELLNPKKPIEINNLIGQSMVAPTVMIR